MPNDYDMQDMAGWADRALQNGGEGGEAEAEGEEEGNGPTTPEQLGAEVDAALAAVDTLVKCMEKVEIPEGEDDLKDAVGELQGKLNELKPDIEALAADIKALPVEEAEESEDAEGGELAEGETEAA